MPHLTDAVIKRLPLPAEGNRVHYDEIGGFGVRVTAGGARSFVLNYVTRAGRERRLTLGGFPNWTVAAAARQKARELKRLIDDGGDPLGDIEDERAAPTVAELIERFQAEHVVRKRPSTVRTYRQMLDLHIGPHFGRHRKVSDVRFEASTRCTARSPGAARPTRRIAASGSRRCSRWRCAGACATTIPARASRRTTRPTQNIPVRRRIGSAYQGAGRVFGWPNRQCHSCIAAQRLPPRRGARHALGGHRSQRRRLDKAGQHDQTAQRSRSAHVGTTASAPVGNPRGAGQKKYPKRPLGEFVFPSSGGTGHLVEIKKGWASVCKAAGITGLRVHDLRHSFASQLASGGASLPLIGALLGHSNPTTTGRYAHLLSDPLKDAVERVGAIVAAASSPPAAPVPISRRYDHGR